MTKEFKTGDIVELKSGGPKMTVQEFNGGFQKFVCQWFAGKKLERGTFLGEQLKRVDQDE